MKGLRGWNARPYARITEQDGVLLPYICRLAPGEGRFELEWFDKGAPDAKHTLEYRKYKSLKPYVTLPLDEATATVADLEDEQDYELRVVREDGQASRLRIVRTGYAPGVTVNYLHPLDEQYATSGRYLCSPSLLKTPSGRLLASMDVFDHGGSQNLTLLFASDDEGAHWHYLSDIMPCFWGKLFLHKGRIYLFGQNGEYGELLLGWSDDDGESWSRPVCLFQGGNMLDIGLQHSPMPFVEWHGRLYTAIEAGSWRFGGFACAHLSVGVDDDLTEPTNWVMTPFWRIKSDMPGAEGYSRDITCLEGNMVVTPDDRLQSFWRINAREMPNGTIAAVLNADPDDPEGALSLDRIVPFEGGHTKFEMLRDPETGKYVNFGNEIVKPEEPGARYVLSMWVSDDLRTWENALRLIDWRHADARDVGFQYPDWLYDKGDILLLSRTAVNRAHSFHDSNRITFHRIANFRRLYREY